MATWIGVLVLCALHWQAATADIDYAKALDSIHDTANLLYQRYEFNRSDTYQFFLEVSNMPPYGWDQMKFKIAQKMVDGNSAYTMIFGGSSVTAGHDNYYRQAHPFVFERRIKPLLAAVGVDLVVRNIAQGANNCRPYEYCYDSMGGEGSDFIQWEQSFNCGRDRSTFEYMARLAAWSNATLYYMASGGWIPQGCSPTQEAKMRLAEDWVPADAGIATQIPPLTAQGVAAYKQLMTDWNGDGNTCSKFSAIYGGLYKAASPFGFNFWAHASSLCNGGKGCDAVAVVGACAAAGGPKWITDEISWYAGVKGKAGKSWHPPAGLHTLRGDVLAYHFTQIIADAVFQVQQDLQSMSAAEASKSYADKLAALHEPIPTDGLYVAQDEGAEKAHCFTNYEPHFNPHQRLDTIVMGNHAESGWTHQKHQSWDPEGTDYGYKDKKPFYQASGSNHSLHLRILDVRHKTIRVCGVSLKDSLANAAFFLDPHYAFKTTVATTAAQFKNLPPAGDTKTTRTEPPAYEEAVDLPYEEYVPTPQRYRVTEVANAGDDCMKFLNVPNGNHVLTVAAHPDRPNHVSTVSHVVIF